MATVVYAARALKHLERASEFLAATDPAAASSAATAIQSAVASLGAHPLIGRRIHGEIRELAISFGRSGHVAICRFLPHLDLVRILTIRHQRELDYPE